MSWIVLAAYKKTPVVEEHKGDPPRVLYLGHGDTG